MDYLLDKYLFDYLPIDVGPEMRKSVGEKAVSIVMWADWVCKYQDPMKIYDNHTSFLFGELLFFILCGLTFIHAYRNGARYMFVWIGILIHALNVENLCYWIPDMDNFWQAQGILTFFGMRAPLYILLGIYHMFDYCAFVMVSKMRLPWWAEGPAVGLGAVMLDMPYDIMGIKLVWWTWHDTDPNIYDRMYWVPWNSYYFHASFACSFVWILRLSRKCLVNEEYDWRKIPRELLCSFLAGTLAFWVGTIQFAALYHPLHDVLGVHSEITTCLFLGFYVMIVWIANRNNKHPMAKIGDRWWFDEIPCAIALEYLFYMVLVLIADPVNVVSEGLHQSIGPCNETQKVQTPSGLVLQKQKYLCAEKYDEKYFDFHCVPGGKLKMPEDGSPLEWYAVCGTEFDNRYEYVAIIWGICILYGCIWYQIASRSGPLPHDPVKVYRLRSPKKTTSHESQPLMDEPTVASPVKTPAKSSTTPKKSPNSLIKKMSNLTVTSFQLPGSPLRSATLPESSPIAAPQPEESVRRRGRPRSENTVAEEAQFRTPARPARKAEALTETTRVLRTRSSKVGICILYGCIWYQIASRSGPLPHDPVKVYRLRSPKKTTSQETQPLMDEPSIASPVKTPVKSSNTPKKSPSSLIKKMSNLTVTSFQLPGSPLRSATLPESSPIAAPQPEESVRRRGRPRSENTAAEETQFRTPARPARKAEALTETTRVLRTRSSKVSYKI